MPPKRRRPERAALTWSPGLVGVLFLTLAFVLWLFFSLYAFTPHEQRELYAEAAVAGLSVSAWLTVVAGLLIVLLALEAWALWALDQLTKTALVARALAAAFLLYVPWFAWLAEFTAYSPSGRFQPSVTIEYSPLEHESAE